jgi:hypothetical protein
MTPALLQDARLVAQNKVFGDPAKDVFFGNELDSWSLTLSPPPKAHPVQFRRERQMRTKLFPQLHFGFI